MVNPKGSIEYTLKKDSSQTLAGKKIFYSVINDYGGESKNEQVLGNAI
jgi:chaperone protein EcpD